MVIIFQSAMSAKSMMSLGKDSASEALSQTQQVYTQIAIYKGTYLYTDSTQFLQ